jgi:hypothetical protein
MSGECVVASTPVLLSSEPSDVQWSHALVPEATLMFRTLSSLDGEWSAWSRCRQRRRSLFGSARTIASIPATHIDGQLEVRPFLRRRESHADDEVDSGDDLEPAGGTMFFILLSNPVVVEEAMMFLDETSKVPASSSGRHDEAAAGATGRAGLFRSLFPFARGRGAERDGAPGTSRAETQASTSTEGGRRRSARLARRAREGNASLVSRSSSLSNEDDPEDRAARRARRAAEWDAELKRVAQLMFDDACTVETMREGCEDAAASGLLHLLRRFGNKAVAATRAPGFDLTALEFLPPARCMENIAACGCPDTLRTLVGLIGIAEDRASGLGDILFGSPELSADHSKWLPLHTAAVTSVSISRWDSVAAVEFVCMMVGSCQNARLWMGGGSGGASRGAQDDDSSAPHSEASFVSSIGGIGFGDKTRGGAGAGSDFGSEEPNLVNLNRLKNKPPRLPDPFRQHRPNGARGRHAERVSRHEDVGFPAEYAPPSVRAGVKDFYEAAATVAVVHADYAAMDAVASVTASLVEQVQRSNGGNTVGGMEYLVQLGTLVKPPLNLNEVIQRCMASSLSDSRLSWMACNLLSDEVCRAALQLIYDEGATAAVWRPFPQHATVNALMHCMGWLDEAVLAEKREKRRLSACERDATGPGPSLYSDDSFFGSDTAGFGTRERALSNRHSNRRAGRTPRSADWRSIDEHDPFDADGERNARAALASNLAERARRFGDIVVRPLLQQTPWNTQKVGLLTFADAEVETQWLEAREQDSLLRERFFALLVLVVFSFALPADASTTDDVSSAYTLGVYSPAKLVPTLFALAFLVGTSRVSFVPFSNLSPARKQLLVCAFRVAHAATSLPATYAKNANPLDAPRSIFESSIFDVFASPACRAALAALLFAELFLPFAFAVRFSRCLPTRAACLVTTRLSFGAWTRTNDVAGFDAPADFFLRGCAFAALAAWSYVREYHDRFSFLMRFFNPGKRKVA